MPCMVKLWRSLCSRSCTMAQLRGSKVGVPYLPSLPTPEGAAKQGFVKAMTAAGLL